MYFLKLKKYFICQKKKNSAMKTQEKTIYKDSVHLKVRFC